LANFIQDGALLAAHAQLPAASRLRLATSLRHVHATSLTLLRAAKSCALDPKATQSRQQLATCARMLTEAINASLDASGESDSPVALAQKECDNALRSIETTRTMIQVSQSFTIFIANYSNWLETNCSSMTKWVCEFHTHKRKNNKRTIYTFYK
jgi:hypothetical protein